VWKYLQRKLGIAELNKRVINMTGTIADVKAALDTIRDDVAPLGTRMDAVAAKLEQLLDSANNPSTTTVLSAEDQALLDSIIQEAGDIKGTVDGLAAKIPAV
jgi:ABC-type transporter Mla subunit MlaD